MAEARPYPKEAQLARGPKRYPRKVASKKQWEALAAAKQGPCRVCGSSADNGRLHGHIHLHHLVPRRAPWFGDDVAANLVPLCPDCHDRVTRLEKDTVYLLLWKGLRDDEYAYAVGKCGEDFWERCYRIEYVR